MNEKLRKKIVNGQTKGMVNAFVCTDLHVLITKNMDDGFIPVRVVCPQCGNPAKSMGYEVNQSFGHTVEWYNPTEAEMQAQMLKLSHNEAKSFKQYILSGNLISRKVDENKSESITGGDHK